jgi:hypothetical protein
MRARFQILQQPLECAAEDVRFAIILTSSIFILHNFLIDVRDELSDDLATELMGAAQRLQAEDQGKDAIEDQENKDVSTRRMLLQHMEWVMNQ